MQDYRKLDVWTKSHELALDVHRVTAPRGADADTFIRTLLCRAVVRIPITIVLGCEADTASEFAQAMRHAAAAVDEFAYLLRFAREAEVLDAVPYAKLEARTNQLRAMLGGLNRTVRLKLRPRGQPAEAVARATGTVARTAGTVARTAGAVALAARGGRDDGSSPRGLRPRSTS